MKMEDCPKFDKCSAPICPLYELVNKQEHFENERVCYYLIEVQKIKSEANFDQSGLGELHEVMVRATREVFAQPEKNKYLQKALLKASKNSSRMARGMQLPRKQINYE